MEIKPYRRRTQYYETDQMGIIHHANYIRWFEEARLDFMDQIGFGYDRAVEAGMDIAVLEVCCQYKKMIQFGDMVDIMVTIRELTPAKMVVGYTITVDGELRTTGHSTHCFMDRELGIVRLNRSIPELYDLFYGLAEQKRPSK